MAFASFSYQKFVIVEYLRLSRPAKDIGPSLFELAVSSLPVVESYFLKARRRYGGQATLR
jgi:hypothetical protein